jgi:DNA modification methylase
VKRSPSKIAKETKAQPAERVETRSLAEITPYPQNARTHTDQQIELLANLMLRYGVDQPIVVDEAGVILKGHGRRLAAIKAGFESFPVVVQRGLSDDDKRALRIADNQVALLAGWDQQLMQLELGELKLHGFDLPLLGFGDAELASFLNPANPGLTDPDEVPAAPAVPISKPGDVWLLGRHRLACGDATIAADVAKAMDGAEANYVFTSPPYGINLEYERGDSLEQLVELIAAVIGTIDTIVAPDAYATMNYADIFRPGDAGFTPMSEHYHKPFAALGWCLRGNRVWFKPFGRLSLAYGTSTTMNLREWEYVRTWRRGRGKEKLREHGLSLRGVWKTFGDDAVLLDWKQYDTTTDKATHPAAFPVVLPVTGMRCYTDENGVVFEPFSGSGTTIIAAEMTGRRCHALEISPAYCDVAIERWQNFTGEQATLDGQTFEQVKAERLGTPEHQHAEAAVTA